MVEADLLDASVVAADRRTGPGPTPRTWPPRRTGRCWWCARGVRARSPYFSRWKARRAGSSMQEGHDDDAAGSLLHAAHDGGEVLAVLIEGDRRAGFDVREGGVVSAQHDGDEEGVFVGREELVEHRAAPAGVVSAVAAVIHVASPAVAVRQSGAPSVGLPRALGEGVSKQDDSPSAVHQAHDWSSRRSRRARRGVANEPPTAAKSRARRRFSASEKTTKALHLVVDADSQQLSLISGPGLNTGNHQ